MQQLYNVRNKLRFPCICSISVVCFHLENKIIMLNDSKKKSVSMMNYPELQSEDLLH